MDSKALTNKALVEREESTPLAGDVLYKARDQIHGDNHDEPWVSEEQLVELEEGFQQIAIRALTKKTFIDNHLESHIFYELKRSSKEKTFEYLSKVLNSEGVVRVAQIIGNSGTDSTNGPYVQFDEKTFSEVVNLEDLRKKVKEIDADTQPVHIQAVLSSILDGNKYYLRDGKLGERW